mgnify:FL=1
MGHDGGCCGGTMKQEKSGGCCGPSEGASTGGPEGGACHTKQGGCGCGDKCACASKPFARNVGHKDAVLRVIIGLALISIVFVGPRTPFGWIGVIPILTAVTGFCGLYRILGISTCKRACCGKCKPA